MTIDDLTLDATQSIDIKADIGDVFRSVLHRFGEGFTKPPEGESMPMTLEQWPGGRWYRDLGDPRQGIVHVVGPEHAGVRDDRAPALRDRQPRPQVSTWP